MHQNNDRRYRWITPFQKQVYNRIAHRFALQPVLETTGRKSGQPRRVPVSGRQIGDQFWFISEFGERSDYIRNIKANPLVRIRLRGRWHTGRAEPLFDDDVFERLKSLPKFSGLTVRSVGTDLLTVRVNLLTGAPDVGTASQHL